MSQRAKLNAEGKYKCNHCREYKPFDEMRKDASYEDGIRPECLACKRKRDTERRVAKGAKEKIEARRAARKEATARRREKAENTVVPEKMLFECTKCERTDIPYEDMGKDKRALHGVSSTCLACRRQKDRQKRDQIPEGKGKCAKCKDIFVEEILVQPPPMIAAGLPKDSMLCKKCLLRIDNRDAVARAERIRRGLRVDASRREIEAAARAAALRDLVEDHPREYRDKFERHLSILGLEPRRQWVSLT